MPEDVIWSGYGVAVLCLLPCLDEPLPCLHDILGLLRGKASSREDCCSFSLAFSGMFSFDVVRDSSSESVSCKLSVSFSESSWVGEENSFRGTGCVPPQRTFSSSSASKNEEAVNARESLGTWVRIGEPARVTPDKTREEWTGLLIISDSTLANNHI